jgi:sulfonate transport system substrate-binding protein
MVHARYRTSLMLASFVVVIGSLAAGGPSRAEVKELRIGIQPGLPSLPVIVAERRGLIAEQARKAGLGDLQVTLHRLSGAPAVNDALLSGSVDASVLGATALISTWNDTRDRGDVRGLLALTTLDATLFTNRPEIKAFVDFGEQDRIAVPAKVSPQAILVRMAADKFYPPSKSAEIDKILVIMPHSEATAALLAGGTITGYMASQPFSMILGKSDKVRALITSKDILDGEETTGAVMAATGKFVDANPVVAKAIIAGLEDAMAFIATNPKAAAEIYINSDSSAISSEDVVKQLTDGSMIYSSAPSGFMKFARFMAKSGQLKREPKSWQDMFFAFVHGQKGS